MAFFSKKEDKRYIQEFDDALSNINELAQQFRDAHFDSLAFFERNFEKEKSGSDLEKERDLFEKHLEVLQKLKLNTDILIDESFKLVRNEVALTEKDRQDLKKLLESTPLQKTKIKVNKKGK
jgi:hypothetical protein